jgi:putative ABC transport system permease protein
MSARRWRASIRIWCSMGSTPYAKVLSSDFQQENMIATMTMLFGALGLLLAAVGLYGVCAEQRVTQEG